MNFKRKILTWRLFRCAQVQRVVRSTHGNAVDRRATVSDDTQAGRFSTVPEAGSAISRAREDISSPIHNSSVQNTCTKAQSVFRQPAWMAETQSTSFLKLNSTTVPRVPPVTHSQTEGCSEPRHLERGTCGRQLLPANHTRSIHLAQ